MRVCACIALLASACTLRFDPVADGGAADAAGDAGPPPCPSDRALGLPGLVDLSIRPTTDGFAVAWTTWDGAGPITDGWFARLDPSGAMVGGTTPFATSPTGIALPAGGLAWDGDGFGVLFGEGDAFVGTLQFARLDGTGAAMGASITVPGAEAEACCGELVWADDAYAAVWKRRQVDETFELVATRLAPEGPESVVLGMDPVDLSARYGGGEVGVGLVDGDRILFLRIDPAGTLLGSPVEVRTGAEQPAGVRVARSTDGYGLAWTEGTFFGVPGRQVHFAAVDAVGTPLAQPVVVSASGPNASGPALAWIDSRFVVTWNDHREGQEEVYARTVDPSGAMLGDEVRVTHSPGQSWLHDVMPAGDRVAVIWVEDQDAHLTLLCSGPPLF